MLADCVWVVVGTERSFASAGIAAMVAFVALGFAGVTLRNGLCSLGGLGCSSCGNGSCSNARTLAYPGLPGCCSESSTVLGSGAPSNDSLSSSSSSANCCATSYSDSSVRSWICSSARWLISGVSRGDESEEGNVLSESSASLPAFLMKRPYLSLNGSFFALECSLATV